MTTDKSREQEQDDTTGEDEEESVPQNLAFAAASTEEDYTQRKLTPDPGSDIGAAAPVVSAVEPLPDTAERPGGPDLTRTFEQEVGAKGEDETERSGVVQKEQRSANPTPETTQPQNTETKPRGVTDPQT